MGISAPGVGISAPGVGILSGWPSCCPAMLAAVRAVTAHPCPVLPQQCLLPLPAVVLGAKAGAGCRWGRSRPHRLWYGSVPPLLCCVPAQPGSPLDSRRWSSCSQASFGPTCTCPAAVPPSEALALLSIHSVLGEPLQLYIQ